MTKERTEKYNVNTLCYVVGFLFPPFLSPQQPARPASWCERHVYTTSHKLNIHYSVFSPLHRAYKTIEDDDLKFPLIYGEGKKVRSALQPLADRVTPTALWASPVIKACKGTISQSPPLFAQISASCSSADLLATCETIQIWWKKNEKYPKKWHVIGIQCCRNTDLHRNLVSVMTQNTKEKVKSSVTVRDIFLAIHVVVCNILSLLHRKGQRRNMIDLSMFSLWPSPVFYLTQTDSRFMFEWWLEQMSACSALCLQPIQVYSCTVGRAHVVSSSFEVSCKDGWLDRVRGLCARERNARALQSPARSLLGPNAPQLIPGCFPFSAGGASPPLWNAFPSLHLFVSFSLPLCAA